MDDNSKSRKIFRIKGVVIQPDITCSRVDVTSIHKYHNSFSRSRTQEAFSTPRMALNAWLEQSRRTNSSIRSSGLQETHSRRKKYSIWLS